MIAEQIVDVEITDVDPAGDGIARHGTRTLVVPFTIPQERVRVRVGRGRNDVAQAQLVEILTPSPHRVVPRCPHFGASAQPAPCGGCAWQHIAYPEQLRLKTRLVERLVAARLARRRPRVHPTLPATPLEDPWGYRQKVHFVFGGDRRTLVMGHYARASRRVIPIVTCPVHDARGNDVAMRIRDEMRRAGVHAAPAGALRSVAMRVSASRAETMGTIVVASDEDKRLRTAVRSILARDTIVTSLHVNVHARGDAFIFGPRTRRINGTDRLREQVAGTSFLVSPTAFFQSNIGAAEVMVRLVLAHVPADAPVLDLYAGAGLFAISLARRGHRVLAIEESSVAVQDGQASARLNRIPADRCRFIAGRVETRLARASPADATVVVLDPPRQGCDRRVIADVFGRLRPHVAVYVSCNPVALGDDLVRIEGYGYMVETLQPLDMFPHTAHIETIAHIRRAV